MKVYTGSAWVAAYASLTGALLVANNLSDLNNVVAARSNLGLGTAATTAATDYATSAQGTLAANALPKAGGTMTGNVAHGDNVKAIFGAGSDLQIYHNGSNSVVADVNAGNLSLQSNGTNVNVYDTANGQTMADFLTGAGVQLKYNGSQKFTTTAIGINVTGVIWADDYILLEATTGSARIEIGGPDGGFIDFKAPFSDDYDGRIISDGASFYLTTSSDIPVMLKHNNAEKMRTTSTGINVTGNVGVGIASPTAQLHLSKAGGTLIKLGTSQNTSEIEAREVGGANSLVLSSNNSTDHLVIADGGAATFSSTVTATGIAVTGSVDFGNWTVTESGGSLYFATGGTNKMKLDASGNLDVVGSVNSNATIT
tara:strand:- start:153 stop:1259 length:1107 start_codon:yes stop_codon:yes gene_type:complete